MKKSIKKNTTRALVPTLNPRKNSAWTTTAKTKAYQKPILSAALWICLKINDVLPDITKM